MKTNDADLCLGRLVNFLKRRKRGRSVETKYDVYSTEINRSQKPKEQKLMADYDLALPLLQDANQETVTFCQYSSPGASDADEKSQVKLRLS
ncbi:hypothetical protein ACET3Z_032211 [Daucus carota]